MLTFEDFIELACCAARDDRDDLAGKAFRAASGTPADAAPAPAPTSLALWSDEELLTELRERFKGKGMALRVVMDTGAAGDAEPAKKRGRPKKEPEPAAAEPDATEIEPTPAASDTEIVETGDTMPDIPAGLDRRPKDEPAAIDPFAADEPEPEAPTVTIDDVIRAGTALKLKDPKKMLDTVKACGFTNIKQVDPAEYPRILKAFQDAMED